MDGSNDDLGLWCIDPIDGTTNFINGLPFFAVSIAWMRARRTRLAVTYNPITDEMFYAREGNGAYLNGRRLPLRQVTADIGRAVGGVDFKRIPKQLADRIAVSPPFYSQRNFGSSTLDWCNLAAGRLDLYLHGGQMLWDYAAGSLILREAGGQMCTLLHDDYDADDVWRRPVIAALHPTVFATWRDWVRRIVFRRRQRQQRKGERRSPVAGWLCPETACAANASIDLLRSANWQRAAWQSHPNRARPPPRYARQRNSGRRAAASSSL
jgi:fructose-1,6-bisphosphatase/inositol monophosphatase family enzyme